jgi:hypothetical protein
MNSNAMVKDVLYFSFLLFFASACKNVSTAYSGEYDGKKLVVQSIEAKGFSTNTITHTVQLGNLPVINIDAFTTDFRGGSYADDVYGNAPHTYIDSTIVYSNEIIYDDSLYSSMLYLSPEKYTLQQFEEYNNCFKNKWPEVEAAINKGYLYFKPHIIGVVYCTNESVTKKFRYKEKDGQYYFNISPDGLIVYYKDDGLNNAIGTDLSGKVQMPGKIILIKDSSTFTTGRLRNYKDEKDKPMEDYFSIRYKVK